MSKLSGLTAACALAVGLSGAAAAQDADTVVATVNGNDITLGHMIAYRQSIGDRAGDVPAPQLFDGILDQLISMTVLADGRELSDTARLILENEERSLKARTVIDEASATEATNEEITEVYNEIFADFESEPEFDASHILVETEEEAQAIIEELDGGADFADLAKARSTGPSGPSGGALGWFKPGQMVPTFDEAVQAMAVGDIAGPVQTQFGWHVIKLNDTRTTEAPSLDEVREQVAEEVVNRRIAALIDERRAAAEIEQPETDIDPSAINDASLIGQ
ncbi:peptidylprolyl isomerase [Maribius pontilimi]|uniref:Parvulin-like PPIase n=1 Tax=Palleronia pontilimi TaxID=1964209 RepID=A0A934IDP7_9RHOB|nr:peptidylprolyl isomerase [Palleronia pontilimi]MBJ3761590.1 peptidylprolyl isomerase [Palleronia pontilimi]